MPPAVQAPERACRDGTPYAWLRLTDFGIYKVLIEEFSKGEEPDHWIPKVVAAAKLGATQRYPLKFVEAVTALSGFSGIHISAPPHAKRGGTMPISVRGVSLSTNVWFRMLGSALN